MTIKTQPRRVRTKMRNVSRGFYVSTPKLPVCSSTGFVRFRDRRQARHGAEALRNTVASGKVQSFSCPDCKGFHLEKVYLPETVNIPATPLPVVSPDATGSRRYVLVDIENQTLGAVFSCEELADLWNRMAVDELQLNSRDHIVIGSSWAVGRMYRPTIQGPNIKWVVGANRPDGADRALLAAINLHAVARNYDELVIVSGDHAFAGLARRAKKLGLRVHVVTTRRPDVGSMLSRELAMAADVRTVVRTAQFMSVEELAIAA